MYTTQELMIYDIGYKTLGRFWSVKRMPLLPYVIHMGLYHRQTKELLLELLLIALWTNTSSIRHGLIERDDMTFRSRAKHLFSSLRLANLK